MAILEETIGSPFVSQAPSLTVPPSERTGTDASKPSCVGALAGTLSDGARKTETQNREVHVATIRRQDTMRDEKSIIFQRVIHSYQSRSLEQKSRESWSVD